MKTRRGSAPERRIPTTTRFADNDFNNVTAFYQLANGASWDLTERPVQ